MLETRVGVQNFMQLVDILLGEPFVHGVVKIKGSEEMSDPNGLYAPNADIAPKAFDTDWTPRTTGVLFCFNGSPWETKDHVL